MQMLTPVGEMAYVNVFRPATPMEGSNKDPQYQLTLIWPKDDDKKLKKLRQKIEEVATEKWGKKALAMLDKGQLKNPLRDGDEREADWMQDHWFLTARSSDKPGAVDADLEDIIDATEIYPGAYGRMDIYLYAYDKSGNKGVGAILNNVQKTEDGERKDGRQSAAEAFGGSAGGGDEGGRSRSRRSSSRRGSDDDEEDDDEEDTGRRGRSSRKGSSSRRSRRR